MKIEVDIPDAKSGIWEVSTFKVTEKDAKLFNMRASFQPGFRIIEAGTYKKLTRNNTIIMSNTSAEIKDHLDFIYKAKKQGDNVLINGLGLGVALVEILKSEKITSVTVIENSEDVIKLVAPYITDSRINIIHADAFTWKPPKKIKYSCVWHDIWDDICSDNLSEMTKLHRKYGKCTEWQGSWCKELCKRY